jgi:hypothetical protein
LTYPTLCLLTTSNHSCPRQRWQNLKVGYESLIVRKQRTDSWGCFVQQHASEVMDEGFIIRKQRMYIGEVDLSKSRMRSHCSQSRCAKLFLTIVLTSRLASFNWVIHSWSVDGMSKGSNVQLSFGRGSTVNWEVW